MFVATFIANGQLRHEHITAVRNALTTAGCVPTTESWIDEGSAADLLFEAEPVTARAAISALGLAADHIIQPMAHREKRLLIADMDSTMITIECIDELADYAGIKPQIAEITERAMRGELDFAAGSGGKSCLAQRAG